MTPVEELREAARLMRERAGEATPGPWRSEFSGPTGCVVLDAGSSNALDHVARTGHYRDHADAAHIASWHPVVALAVADWLDHEATTAFELIPSEEALVVARAYLGRTP